MRQRLLAMLGCGAAASRELGRPKNGREKSEQLQGRVGSAGEKLGQRPSQASGGEKWPAGRNEEGEKEK